MNPIVLITDFGTSSPYVAEMKGAILGICPQAIIVDGTHAVEPQNVFAGAQLLRQLAASFAHGSIFVVVVDPGVGTSRSVLLAQQRGQSFIAPDNGLLSFVLTEPCSTRVLDKPEFWRRELSATFHGRDMMGPVAAHLALGLDPKEVASPNPRPMVRLQWPEFSREENAVRGEIVLIDTYGNLISNIPARCVSRHLNQVLISGRKLPVCSTYGEQAAGSCVALVGSGGWLEVAMVNGSAQREIGVSIGSEVVLRSEGRGQENAANGLL